MTLNKIYGQTKIEFKYKQNPYFKEKLSYMKKLTLLLVCIGVITTSFAQQKVRIEKVEPDSTTQEIVQYRTRANHWSIMGSIGVGRIDGDQMQVREQLIAKSMDRFNVLFNVEYSISPIWGVYLEYLYAPYGGYSRYVNKNILNPLRQYINDDIFEFRGVNHEATVGVSLNVLNLLYNCRPQKWQWYVNGGLGLSFFDMKYHSRFPNKDYENDILNVIPWDKDNNKFSLDKQSKSLTFPLATTVEWNATRWLALLANAQYRFHSEDYYDASVVGNDDDHYMYLGLGVRLKFNWSKNKYRMHVRDMAMCQYELNMAEETAKRALRRVDSLKPIVEELQPRVKALEDDMKNLRDSDGDGVPDIRDRQPNTPKNVPVNSFGEMDYGQIPDNRYHNGNPSQLIKDPCDVDGDGIQNAREKSQNDDLDGDGQVNMQDSDMDGDGIPNEWDPTPYGQQNCGGAGMPTGGEDGCHKIYYNTAKFDIRAISEETLAEVARMLEADPSLKIEIKSYADEQGVRKGYNNQRLTENRAKETRRVLIKKYGVDSKRIVSYKGYGAVKGAPSIDYLPNRRTDICFVK